MFSYRKRLTTLSQRNTHPHQSSSSHTPSPVLYPPSGPSGSSSGSGSSGQAYPYLNAGPGAGTSYSSSGRPSPSPSLYNRPNSAASQYSESPFGGGMSSNGGGSGMGMGMGSRDTSVVEGQNDERLEGLLGKVKILKDITVGIGNEVRDSNIQLGNMNDTFSSTSNFLGGTFRRMNKMASKQGGNWCWFMGFLLLVLWIFVVVWWLRR
ncbi:hypothetical protein IAU59_000467 [Kwoniella sp. CBS 9459]